MHSRIVRSLLSLELEERILNSGAIIAAGSVFLPWFSGEWLGGEMRLHTGFGFYTSFLGLGVFLLNLFLIALTLIPLIGGPMLVRVAPQPGLRAPLPS